MSITLISSPLQGFTDFHFRNAFNKHFGGIDSFYSPYIRLNGKLEIKSSHKRDILPENNKDIVLVPQIMTKEAEEFIFVAKHVQSLGYKELNWNLGCPYPMATKRNMGSGLIQDYKKINSILEEVYNETDIDISIKMRNGQNSNQEILKVLPILDKFPIKNITIHPRIGLQMYKGKTDLDIFQQCIENTNHKIQYNGDITSVESFQKLSERFPKIDHWMIGRGILTNPFLPSMIINGDTNYPKNKLEIFKEFHDTLFNGYEEALSGPGHLTIRMFQFWEYFIQLFPNSQKGLKKVKKASSIHAYNDAVNWILRNEKSFIKQ